ncbi:tRNA 4-thiouridine(8) synthase ThiI [archaeon SCG-AAA382B04]|nr:tRNA 4-thiouridine(8) synthase ThiI [archaeon SCG-AAA382B04]
MPNKTNWDLVLARFGEIGLKTTPVRNQFLNRLIENTRYSLKKEKIDNYEVTKTRGRIYIKTNEIQKALRALSYVSGVVSYSPVKKTTSDKQKIIETSTKIAKSYITKNDSFAVETNRVGEHDYNSLDINEELGKRIQNHTNAEVDLDNPDKKICLDIRHNNAYIFKQKIRGLMGLPTGVQGEVVSLFSGGIDSPVAATRLVKRGCYVTPIYIKKGKYSSEEEFERAKIVAEKFSRYIPKQLKLLVIDLEPVFEKINEHGGRNSCLLCKRVMYRAAETVAEEKNYLGIVTGESLGQVASQTLHNLKLLEETTHLPIYRPLIGYDKVETMEVSRKLGLFESSKKDVGECPILPSKVKTRANLKEIKQIEKELDLVESTKKLAKNNKKIVFN